MQKQKIKYAGFFTILFMLWLVPTLAIALPAISINDVTVNEGAGKATFTVLLSVKPVAGKNVTVTFSTANGTAVAPSDYTATSKLLTFTSKTSLTQTVDILIIDDPQYELSETFSVKLSNLKNVDMTKSVTNATGKIQDNDFNHGPICKIDSPSGTTTINVGQSVNYSGTITDSDNNLASINWSFPGGTPASSSSANPGSVTYNSAGTYTTILNATDIAGAKCPEQTVTITVKQPPVCVIETPTKDISILAGRPVYFSSKLTGFGQNISIHWDFGNGTTSSEEDPGNIVYDQPSVYTASLTATDATGSTCTIQRRNITVTAVPNISINSNSTNSTSPILTAVSVQNPALNNNVNIFSVNDLGMHCMDLDSRIANILPPFQVNLSQVIQKAVKPIINPAGIEVYYSATHNEKDPILNTPNILNGLNRDGTTFKTNFWDTVAKGSYDQFYPGGLGLTPLAAESAPFRVTEDVGLPVPNVENFYIGPDGIVDGDYTNSKGAQISNHDGYLSAVQHTTPGIADPYKANSPQKVNELYDSKPMFVKFPFGYVAPHVNWFEAAGIPVSLFDDFGVQNPFPLFNIEAKDTMTNTVVASVPTVLPVSGETSCSNCHAYNATHSTIPSDTLRAAGFTPVDPTADPDLNSPIDVSVEYATDINILRLHDVKHGANYVNTSNGSTPCVFDQTHPDGTDSCLYKQAVVDQKPVVCQGCHYTPALDLAHLGPLSGAPGSFANGRNQLAHQSNSRVMHNFHAGTKSYDGGKLFPDIPSPKQDAATGAIINQSERLAALEDNCYQCHPGKKTKCLRGAMFNGGMLCSDCHGSLEQVGDDFTRKVSTTSPGPGVYELAKDFYNNNTTTPRVPWANEPGCGSCHTGDANNNMVGNSDTIVNIKDSHGVTDGIRLRQAFRNGDSKATPIVPSNKRFAEPAIAKEFNGFPNPGADNPQLYRVSTGHGGVMCEGCHGPTHAEWPVANPDANDNQTAMKIQGHAGPIIECTACHDTASLSGFPTNTQKGPHGMHLVNDSRWWTQSHKDVAKAENAKGINNNCTACHGADDPNDISKSRRGTVLSRAVADRSFMVEGTARIVKKGQPIGCNLCHSVEKSQGR